LVEAAQRLGYIDASDIEPRHCLDIDHSVMPASKKYYRFAIEFETRDPTRKRFVTEYFRTAVEVGERIGCHANTVFNILNGKDSKLSHEYDIKRVKVPIFRMVRTEQIDMYDANGDSDDSD